ncbi:MAG TPA: deoxyribose-phosphate aldolase [Acidimicrobiales bacterium]|nr:deoxyribose-phosphate aldolase [Acidimicrobiales bacterium]
MRRDQVLDAIDLSELQEIRARHPEAIIEAAARRTRRPMLNASGRIMVIAADHPARGALGAGGRALAMADRKDLLTRLTIALSRPGVDGLLASPDIIDDLLLLGALEEKVVFGSMNRGGLQGSEFEFDDRFTSYDAPAIASARLDGGKMLCRINYEDPRTVATLESCAHAVSGLAEHRLLALIEPFVSRLEDGRATNDLSAQAVITSVAIASGLGTTSAYTWLKLPVIDEMERVMAATTLPTVLLGGDPHEAPDVTYAQWERALGQPGVRGLVVGRALLYPPDDDVEAAVDIAARLVSASAKIESQHP